MKIIYSAVALVLLAVIQPPAVNPQCPHRLAIQRGLMQTNTNCAPPVECICQQACAVLCKP